MRVLPMILPVDRSSILNAPLLSMAPSKKVWKTVLFHLSLLGCCIHISGSDATAYNSSKSLCCKGQSRYASFSKTGCVLKAIGLKFRGFFPSSYPMRHLSRLEHRLGERSKTLLFITRDPSPTQLWYPLTYNLILSRDNPIK